VYFFAKIRYYLLSAKNNNTISIYRNIFGIFAFSNLKPEVMDLSNIDKIHSTKLGIERIKRNLGLNDYDNDVVSWCKQHILNENSVITRKGKNWYVNTDNYVITINANSYTIITAHNFKKRWNKSN